MFENLIERLMNADLATVTISTLRGELKVSDLIAMRNLEEHQGGREA